MRNGKTNPASVSVHSSGAHFRLLRESHRTPVKGVVLHWWTGAPELTEDAVRLGCHFSVPPAMISSRGALEHIPLRPNPVRDRPQGTRRRPTWSGRAVRIRTRNALGSSAAESSDPTLAHAARAPG
ncbi:TatD family hydrolase [Microbacterium sp. H83]|uniref:TatD family hydrolase n=1 Tax=Microbacterium sp. H83 TaxID=1827324 RepID=UPI0018D2C5DE